jgi:hypothetical protein
MDMRRHLRRWLNDAALREMHDRYEGRITSATEELIRNRFTAEKQLEPVISFDDGFRMIPNVGQRRQLIEFWGANTEDWIGRTLIVFRHRVERKDANGDTVERWQKSVMLPDNAVEFPRPVRRRRAR